MKYLMSETFHGSSIVLSPKESRYYFGKILMGMPNWEMGQGVQ